MNLTIDTNDNNYTNDDDNIVVNPLSNNKLFDNDNVSVIDDTTRYLSRPLMLLQHLYKLCDKEKCTVDEFKYIFIKLLCGDYCVKQYDEKHKQPNYIKYVKQYQPYVNPYSIREYVCNHINNELYKANPDTLSYNDGYDIITIPLLFNCLEIHIVGFNSRGGFKYNKQTSLNDLNIYDKIIFSYGFYIKLYNTKDKEYLVIGNVNSVDKNIDHMQWGYPNNMDSPFWLLKNKPLMINTKVMLITLNYNDNTGWHYSDNNTIYPTINNKLNNGNKFKLLKHIVCGDLFCIKNKLMSMDDGDILDETIRYNTKKRLEISYLPIKLGNVFGIIDK